MKLYYSLCFSFLSIIIQAQESGNSKDWILGGNFRYFNSQWEQISEDENESKTFSWTPYVGNQITKKWLLGVQLRFGWTERDQLVIASGSLAWQRSESNLYGVGVFSRYHLAAGERWAVFLQPSYLYSLSKQETEVLNITSKSEIRTHNVSTSLGGYFNISKFWRVTINMGNAFYEIRADDPENGNELNSQTIGIDMSMSNLRFGLEMMF